MLLCFSCLPALILLHFVSFFGPPGHSSVSSSSSLTQFLLLVFSYTGFHPKYFASLSIVYISFTGPPTIVLCCAYYLLGCSYCLSLLSSSPLFSLHLPIGFSRMRFTIPCTCCPCRSPLLVASYLLPSFGFGCRCSLIPSPYLFTCAVFRGSLYRRSGSLGLVRASALAFSIYASFCFASASLLSGCSVAFA